MQAKLLRMTPVLETFGSTFVSDMRGERFGC